MHFFSICCHDKQCPRRVVPRLKLHSYITSSLCVPQELHDAQGTMRANSAAMLLTALLSAVQLNLCERHVTGHTVTLGCPRQRAVLFRETQTRATN